MPCEVSMVLWSESRGRKIIPACFYWQNVRRSTEKSCPFMMLHYPNCNSPAASRPPLRRSSAHLNRPAFCTAWKRSLSHSQLTPPRPQRRCPSPDGTCLQCAPLDPLIRIWPRCCTVAWIHVQQGNPPQTPKRLFPDLKTDTFNSKN